MTERNFQHKAVLASELVASLNLSQATTVFDCTAGGGGHLEMVLLGLPIDGVAVGIDRDPDAIAHLQSKFEGPLSTGRLKLIKSPFSQIMSIASELGLVGKVSAVYADLGVSSHQLDRAERGFSFSNEGPLDMRMAYDSDMPTAAELLNSSSEEALADIFYYFGEIRESRRLARKVVEFRKSSRLFAMTSDLVDVSCSVLGPKRFGHSHPATRVFQALRIAVNHELDEAKQVLDDGFEVLAPKGRFSVISFHSLEDRLVKQKFAQLAGRGSDKDLPREIAVMREPVKPRAAIIKPFPVDPSETEINLNPRARSAKLRVIEKLAT